MRRKPEITEAGRQYAAAYAAHYTDHDLRAALQLYMKHVASHPGAQEAGYARAQIQNIVNTVVSKQELLDAQAEMAFAHLEGRDAPEAGRIPPRPVASEPPI